MAGIIVAGALLKFAACGARRRWYTYGGYGGYGGGGGCGEGGGGCGPRARGWGGGGGRGGWAGWGHGRGHDDREYSDGERAGERDGFGFGFGKRFFLRFLFERLDTTPGQEKVIAEAFDEIRESLKAAKGDWGSTRSRVADAMRGAEFDHEAAGEAWAKHDNTFEAMRLKVTTALQRVHEALDERQRKILADLIERGGPFGARVI